MVRQRLTKVLVAGTALLTTLVGTVVVRSLPAHGGLFRGTIAVGNNPVALAVDDRSSHIFVVNEDDGSVSVLDGVRGTVVRTVAVGMRPVAVAVDARTARAFVLNSNTTPIGTVIGPGTVSVLDTRTGALLRTITVGSRPTALAIDERTNRVFVANRDDDSISVLDATSGGVLHTRPTGLAPVAVAIDSVSARVFIANLGSGTVTMLDAARGRTLRTVAVGAGTQGPEALAVDESAGRVFVSTGGGNTGAGPLNILNARSGTRIAVQGTSELLLAVDAPSHRVFTLNRYAATVRDARTGAALHTIPWLGRATPAIDWEHTAAVDARTGLIIVPTMSGLVLALDGWTGRLARQVPVGPLPSAIATDPYTGQVFVVNTHGHAGGDTSTWKRVVGGIQQWMPWLAHPAPPPPSLTGPGTVTVLDAMR